MILEIQYDSVLSQGMAPLITKSDLYVATLLGLLIFIKYFEAIDYCDLLF